MIFRTWEFKDIMGIALLEKELFPGTAWTFEMLADSFHSNKFGGVVCEENGLILGYGGVTFGVDDAEIDNIGVREPYRGNGIGKTILGRLVKMAKERKMERILLEVRVSNTPAQLLYLHHGFHGLYTRPRYYPDGEDAVVMVRELQ
ncbi:MAG: ribosomal protein S18-alanine N-acetyltransferase [Clostridia bacterium]|nr:ribosomal protein S18-alanine N-acetyltransferase [Clostridia bacterium]